MTTSHAPIRAGRVTPKDDDAAGLGSDGGTKDRDSEHQDSASAAEPHNTDLSRANQALCVIDGEGRAAQYLGRLQAQQADPDELALIVSMLYGAALRGFCRVIEKALGVQHA